MKITVLQYVLWWTAPVLQSLIAFAMVRRKQVREFPLFFSYTVFHILQFIATYTVYRASYRTFFYTYWVTEIIDSVFTLIVIQEVFAKVFQPYKALRRLGLAAFRWGTVLLCALSIITAVVGPSAYSDRLISSLSILQRSAELIQAGLLLLLFLSARLFGVSWRHYVFGISLGFGISAATGLIIAAFRTEYGRLLESLTAPLLSASVLLGIAIWAFYFISAKSTTEIRELPSSSHLQEWNEALASLLRQESHPVLVRKS